MTKIGRIKGKMGNIKGVGRRKRKLKRKKKMKKLIVNNSTNEEDFEEKLLTDRQTFLVCSEPTALFVIFSAQFEISRKMKVSESIFVPILKVSESESVRTG